MKKTWILGLLWMLCTLNIVYADVNGPYRDGYIEGYIKDKLDGKIQIEEYDGTLHVLPFTKDVHFMIDDRDATLVDFKPGMEIYATLKGRSIDYIESYSTENPGYIKEGSKVRVGAIKKIDRDQITLKLITGGEETYFTSPATIALKNGNNVALNTLYEGDRIKLYFDEMNSTMASRISIEGESILIKDLYRGKIALTNDIEDKITLEGAEYFKNGKWEASTDQLTIDYNNEVPIYVGGQKITNKNLKLYKGKTAYMAIKDFFGGNKIEKMVIKSQYESNFSDKIEDINWYSEKFELSNKQNISFGEGSMIIRNGRLIDRYSLNEDADAFVVADGRGSDLTADVIYVYNEEVNNSNIGQNYIYTGRLRETDMYSVELDKFYLLEKNEWVSFDKKKDPPLYYDEDTYLYDLDNNKKLTTKEFFALNTNNKDYYVYIYADGDRMSSAFVQKKMDSLLAQRVTNGTIESASQVGGAQSITLRDAKDWSDRKNQWMMRNTSLNVIVKNVMIIKNGKTITPEELQVGDKLYMVRDDIYGKVIIVK